MNGKIETMRSHKELVFPLPEYQRRMENLRGGMEAAGIEWLLVTEPDNLTYLTGHETSGYGTFQCLLVSVHGDAISFCRLLEQSNFETRTWVPDMRNYRDHQNPATVLLGILQEKGVRRLGLELDGMFLPRKVERALAAAVTVVPASGLVEKGRIIKSEAEIALLRRTARITEAGMRAGMEVCREGVAENEIAAAVHAALYSAGGEYPSVPPYISCGPRTIIGHATWTDRKAQNGECIFLEMAGCLKRYHTAMMRTLFVGKPPQAFIDAEKLVLEHLQILREKMRPGVSCHEIDMCTRDEAAFQRIGATRVSRTGYSMGISFAPAWDEGHVLSLVEGEERTLAENMVFHVIPWLQLPELGMVMSISETVRVTAGGAESFFDLPLEVMTV